MADIKRIDSPEDPERCQGVSAHGQCQNKATPGFKYCLYHGGYPQDKDEAEKRNYNLGLWQCQLQQKLESSTIKSLRDEVGILRILLEKTISRCTDDQDLLLQTNIISDLISKVERTVVSCHKLEQSLKNVLDKQEVLQLASEILAIIAQNVTDSNIIKTIATDIQALFAREGDE
jgi:hypothetical protein